MALGLRFLAVFKSYFRLSEVALHHLGHIGAIDGAYDTHHIVFDAECAGFHQLGNRQQLAAQLFGHIDAIARSGKIENLHNLILGDF